MTWENVVSFSVFCTLFSVIAIKLLEMIESKSIRDCVTVRADLNPNIEIWNNEINGIKAKIDTIEQTINENVSDTKIVERVDKIESKVKTLDLCLKGFDYSVIEERLLTLEKSTKRIDALVLKAGFKL